MSKPASPRISIVTPNYNGAVHIEETIKSVLAQNYNNLEYIIADGGSSDGSLNIIDKYRPHFATVISEKDRGHSDAVNKGFAASTGEIMGWINSDDVLLPGALQTVAQVFEQFPQIQWISGRAAAMSEDGIVYTVRSARPWTWLRFLAGDYRHIQQESTYWRRSLWDKAGGQLDERFGIAGDFELWTRFFKHAELYPVDALIGCFRFRKSGQLSRSAGAAVEASAYNDNTARALKNLLASIPPEDLAPHVALLTKAPAPLPSWDFDKLPANLGAIDPQILRFDRHADGFSLDGVARPQAKPDDVRTHAAPTPFSGTGGIIVAEGPDFTKADLVGFDLRLRSRELARTPETTDEHSPAMPALIGPVAIYDRGAGKFQVQLRFGDELVVQTLLVPAGDALNLKVSLSAKEIAFVANGELVLNIARPSGPPAQHAGRLLLGSGFAQRHWNGTVEALRLVTRTRATGAIRVDQFGDVAHKAEDVAVAPPPVQAAPAPRMELPVATPAAASPPAAPGRLSSYAPVQKSLLLFKNRHRGERCFVMGNGPSLNKMDLELMAGDTVFACNGSFLLFDRVSWKPRYYTCVDTRVIRDRASDINEMLDAHPQITGYFPREVRLHDGTGRRFDTVDIVKPGRNRYYFNEVTNSLASPPATMFSLDANRYVVQPYTVAITMLQLAAYMGFKTIYLIGCDTSYAIDPSVKQEGRQLNGTGLLLTSTDDNDSNHFDPRYFGKGREWHNPQVDQMIMHHGWAQKALQSAGIEVFNATVGGNLEVYKRADYNSLFTGRQGAPASATGASA